MGSGAKPQKILVFDPMLGWADLPMVLCMIFAHGFGCDGFLVHGFGRDGFRSMVLDALTCINMYCNIERNIMKNQARSPIYFGTQGKISIYMCFMYYNITMIMNIYLKFSMVIMGIHLFFTHTHTQTHTHILYSILQSLCLFYSKP